MDILNQCDQEQKDEIEAIQSIYEDYIEIINNKSYSISIPYETVIQPLKMTIDYPKEYPINEPPILSLYAQWLDDSYAESLYDALIELFNEQKGQVVIYNWIEWLRENVSPEPIDPDHLPNKSKSSNKDENEDDDEEEIDWSNYTYSKPDTTGKLKENLTHEDKLIASIVHGAPFTDRRSTFQAHLAPVHCVEDVEIVLNYLLQDRKIKRATHNIQCSRIFDAERNIIIKDNDDDGEHGAGRKVAELFDTVDARNVFVVVSRWFGGILLGPDRFKHINNSAREILEEYGYIDKRTKKK